ncbi:MAG: PhoH family protein [Firmicutes bacterium]|jgi:phosphate starvation-inducible PhoH-like protein|nr:PhoH family protein [Bacillota bacterium]MDH7495020.1 PhoH family protein [Bacillota bacterium]
MALFGKRDETLRLVEKELGVTISSRGDDLAIDGDPTRVARAREVLTELLGIVRAGHRLTSGDIRYAIDMVSEGFGTSLVEVMSDVVQVTTRGKRICPKTLGQKRYIEAMRRSGIVFAIGPAGTGKTYLAMAMAIAALKSKEISRIVLTRPVVEAGEKLGFLPGDLQEKVDPYLRPLYDAIYDIVGVDAFRKHMERGVIEIAPLAYMRGRTLDDSFIILDEAQNTTHEQMKMFLTRMGFGSKIVVTGDLTQTDLPSRKFSGLEEIQHILRGVEGVEFVYLSDRDVVRNELVQRVIRAYERYEHDKEEA